MSKVLNHQSTSGTAASPVRQPLVPVSALPKGTFQVEHIPDRRYIPLAEHGTDRSRGSPGTESRHQCGVFGEFAVAQFLGMPLAVDTQIYELGDPGYDLDIAGRRIDVKTTRQSNTRPSLMVDAKTELTADFYVLVQQLDERCYRILGYAPRQVVASAPTRSVGKHRAKKVREVDQDTLIPLPASFSDVYRNRGIKHRQ